MKILVTGGAGYIGSIATECIIKAGHDAVVYDSLYMGHTEAVHPDATFVEGDLADRALLTDCFQQHQPDAVMHFASHTQVGESMEQPFLYLGDNIRNALNLLEVMDAHDVKRFILSSTANLFDEPETTPINEQERLVPGSPYGESKFIIERFLHWLRITKGFRYACLRYFNAAGATAERGEDHTPESHLIPLVLQVALGQRDSLKIFGDDYDTPDGSCVRDYIHIADLAKAHLLALESLEHQECCHYNLGNGAGFSVKQVIDTAREITGHPIPAETVARRAGDPATLVADSSKIREELGWQPDYPTLEAIIQSAWDWHKSHPNGYSQD
ncbi:MAG: UDP-glucose 4-epimerase GalE [Verrucomicrobiales bacterium]|nr:UDP-glucose 4-epimerase GalE [Verrucomicrobiales bacterium]